MKKFLAITLSCLTALSLFACAGNNTPETHNDTDIPQGTEHGPIITDDSVIKITDGFFDPFYRDDVMIQDDDGTYKCLWDDGKARFDDYYFTGKIGTGRQNQKSAVLTVQTEYDLWFEESKDVLLVGNEEYYWPLEYEYDETKIEIKSDPDKENHFILKILQPCEDETITFIITEKTWWAGEINRKDLDAHLEARMSITVSTTD